MSEVTRLKMDLQARKFAKMEIEIEAAEKLKSLKALLAGYAIRSLGEIDLYQAFDVARDLRDLKKKWEKAVEDIETLEKELRG